MSILGTDESTYSGQKVKLYVTNTKFGKRTRNCLRMCGADETPNVQVK